MQVELQVELKKDNLGTIQVNIDGTNFGVFDDAMGDSFAFYPRRNEQITGDHYIAIGIALNELNDKKN
ncbi:MAG: hypothetical protein CL840_03410 [Crocinitomicaceae bacterium]|jgi:hypothetical protein|nr:hypothetical protein [Crocinitomicaceae bacterium]|tara:strand:- start:332572 stop:332775 length:204 start_codon:yes stop_codon:yes gene_type:complete